MPTILNWRIFKKPHMWCLITVSYTRILCVALDQDEHKIDKLPKFYKTENRFDNEGYISNSNLKTMKDSIINHKELQCEPQKRKQTNPLQALLDSRVNQRTSKCTSYINSLFKVLYPKGMNPRKK